MYKFCIISCANPPICESASSARRASQLLPLRHADPQKPEQACRRCGDRRGGVGIASPLRRRILLFGLDPPRDCQFPNNPQEPTASRTRARRENLHLNKLLLCVSSCYSVRTDDAWPRARVTCWQWQTNSRPPTRREMRVYALYMFKQCWLHGYLACV